MNCQIVQIKSDILELKVISSRVDNSFKLASLVEIDKTSYLEYQNLSLDKNQSKLFGEIVEISFEILKLRLFKPSLFTIGKIVKLNVLKVESLFLPQVLNRTIVFGETFELDSEQIFEFIPTVLAEEQVVEGQKIGYINTKTTLKQNFKHWILAMQTGKISKIELGNFKFGQQIAVINRSNILLGNYKRSLKANNILQKTGIESKSLIIHQDSQIDLKIKTGQSNLILDVNKKFLNSLNLKPQQIEEYILIFVTQDQSFVADSQYKSVTFFDKYNLTNALSYAVCDFAMSICELGYNVIIISQNSLSLNVIGQYKTINGEDPSITYILQDYYNIKNHNHFDNIITIN